MESVPPFYSGQRTQLNGVQHGMTALYYYTRCHGGKTYKMFLVGSPTYLIYNIFQTAFRIKENVIAYEIKL